ncbi:MAG: DUF1667 domain-containing protein [Fusobacteriota bacterium]
MKKEMICISCPIGCRLTVISDETEESGYRVEGNICPRGKAYGIKEMTNPTRIIPTTVKIEGALLPRLPVKTEQGVPKEVIFDCMDEINKVEVEAPVKLGDIIIKNILDTGVNIVATRSMKREKES